MGSALRDRCRSHPCVTGSQPDGQQAARASAHYREQRVPKIWHCQGLACAAWLKCSTRCNGKPMNAAIPWTRSQASCPSQCGYTQNFALQLDMVCTRNTSRHAAVIANAPVSQNSAHQAMSRGTKLRASPQVPVLLLQVSWLPQLQTSLPKMHIEPIAGVGHAASNQSS